MLRRAAPLSVLIALALTGCNASAPAPQAESPQVARSTIAQPDFKLPPGSGCSGDITRWEAVLKNDVDSGNVNQSVYNEIQREISSAAAACSAGRDGEARALVSASKRRHGYPG